MLPANMYVIRLAADDDAAALVRLAGVDSQRPLTGRVLVGEIDGTPAAALSLTDGRVVADPFRSTAHLLTQLRIRASARRAYERTPALAERMLALLPRVTRASARSAA